MTASERAQELVRRLSAAAMSVVAPGGSKAGLNYADDKAALLAYVARLEAVVDAARSLETCLMTDEIDCSVDERIARLFRALAALDRPEDGETK